MDNPDSDTGNYSDDINRQITNTDSITNKSVNNLTATVTDNNADANADANAETDKNADAPANNWLSFFKSVFYYFILTLLIGLFGSSFIYLTTRGSDIDIMLPTNAEFYNSNKYEDEQTGPSSDINCNIKNSGSYAVWEDNFPYNLIKTPGSSMDELRKLSFTERLRTWFAKTVGGCFKTNRALLKGWLDNFRPNTPLGNHAFQIFIAMPITLLFSFVALITGPWSAFGAAVTSDMKVTVWGFIVLYIWPLLIGLALIIFLRLLATLLFLPMIQNWKEVSNIMSCNAKILVIFFSLFVYISASKNLDSTTANMMGLVYLCLVSYTLWKFVTSE